MLPPFAPSTGGGASDIRGAGTQLPLKEEP